MKKKEERGRRKKERKEQDFERKRAGSLFLFSPLTLSTNFPCRYKYMHVSCLIFMYFLSLLYIN
jgi:hypothetical protein